MIQNFGMSDFILVLKEERDWFVFCQGTQLPHQQRIKK